MEDSGWQGEVSDDSSVSGAGADLGEMRVQFGSQGVPSACGSCRGSESGRSGCYVMGINFQAGTGHSQKMPCSLLEVHYAGLVSGEGS